MANTYNWTISAMERYPEQNSLTGVVHTIHWRMTATSDQNQPDGNPYVVDTFGAFFLGEPDAADFVEYTSLTPSIVEGWLEAGLDVAEIKSALDAQLDDLINPSNLTEEPPWMELTPDPAS